jgi:hypothetical protein
LTRILINYKQNLLATHAAILLLLGLGKEEQTLGTTLDSVKVVVHVKHTNSEGKGRNDHTVHLAGGPGIGRDDSDKHDLNDGELGNLGHGEARLDGRNLLGGSGLGIHRLRVTRHFYFILRK